MTRDDAVDVIPLTAVSQDVTLRTRLLGALFEQSFGEPHGEAAVATLMHAPGSRALVAQRRIAGETQAIGYVILRSVADEAEILSIGVVPASRRAGVGRALLDAALADAASAGAAAVFLEVGEDNPSARAMYRAVGFMPVGRRPNYYQRADRSRIAAIIMRKSVRRT